MPGNFGTCRKASPAPGGSILITSAPKSANNVAAVGAAMKLPQSITFKPSKILLIGSASGCCDLGHQPRLVWSPSIAIACPEMLRPPGLTRKTTRPEAPAGHEGAAAG